jgi:ParB/RepB/Spo0J family partition protein
LYKTKTAFNLNQIRRTMTDKFGTIEPSKLKLHPAVFAEDNPRLQLPLDLNLLEDIRANGVRIPLLAIKAGKDILVVAGSRRLKAALEIEKLDPTFRIPILASSETDDASVWHKHLVENNLRQQNSPLTQAYEIAACVRSGQSYEAIATMMGMSHQTARNYAMLATMPAFIKADVERGAMSPTAAFALQTSRYRKEIEGQQIWDSDKLRDAIAQMKADNKLAKGGGKISVSTAKGQTDRWTYDEMRKLAAQENVPPDFAILLQALVGDITTAHARNVSDGALAWLLKPTKGGGRKAGDKATKPKGKPKKNATLPVSEEALTSDTATVDGSDLDALFN